MGDNSCGGIAMRQILAGWAAAAILAVPAAAHPPTPAAVVTGEPIPVAEVEAVMAMRPRELFPVPASQLRQVRLEILEGLIGERLMKQFLLKSGTIVDSADVDRQMVALADAQKAAGKTMADYCRETQ